MVSSCASLQADRMRLAWEMVCERIEANGELGGRKSQKLEEIVFSPWCWPNF